MIKDKSPQFSFQMICLEDYVPKDHLLRKIDRHIDFSFIRELTEDLYCADNGRPAVHPVALFKMLFIGYLFGIRSERRLVQELEVNLAYRWFIGYDLDEGIPNHSTFSHARRRFSARPELVREVFDRIVLQGISHGLIDGTVLYTDSTHIKANANKKRFEPVTVSGTPMEYIAELDREVDRQRRENGKKPLDRDGGGGGAPHTHEVKRSTTDPDAGFMTRDGKPKGFFYLDHRTVDGRFGLIVDSHVTPGNINDARPYPSRLRHLKGRFGFDIRAVGVDAGYKTTYIAKVLSEMGIYGVAGYRRPVHRGDGMFYPRGYRYDRGSDSYTCPGGQELTLSTIDRRGYRVYRSGAGQCQECPHRAKCTRSPSKQVFRHVWQDHLDELDSHRLTPYGKAVYQRRKETVERSFADGKELHGLRYARFRGLWKVQMQCLFVAICQNMKKMALVLSRRDDGDDFLLFQTVFSSVGSAVERFFGLMSGYPPIRTGQAVISR